MFIDRFRNLLSFCESKIIQLINLNKPFPIQIDVTNACNLNCIHCYHPHHKNINPLSFDELIQILSQYKTFISKYNYKPMVIISGGEPLTSVHLDKLIKYISLEIPNCKLTIHTNGTLITKDYLNRVSFGKNIEFQVSLDGYDNFTHDKVRGEGNFDRALRGIKNLKENGYSVYIATVISLSNYLYIEEYFKLSLMLNTNYISFNRLVEVGSAQQMFKYSLPPKLLRKAYSHILICMHKYKINSNTNIPLFNLIDPRLGKHHRYSEGFVISYDGYYLLSSRSQFKLDSIKNISLEKFYLNNEMLRKLRNSDTQGCESCFFKKKCSGDPNISYALYGSFFKKDPGCWV